MDWVLSETIKKYNTEYKVRTYGDDVLVSVSKNEELGEI